MYAVLIIFLVLIVLSNVIILLNLALILDHQVRLYRELDHLKMRIPLPINRI